MNQYQTDVFNRFKGFYVNISAINEILSLKSYVDKFKVKIR